MDQRIIKYSYTHDEWDKIGNTLIYLTEKIGSSSKTKLLKLLYILDEMSIKRSGIPFLNLRYELWKFGPVAQDVFIELSSQPNKLSPYIERITSEAGVFVKPINSFNNDEFTDNDIDLMDEVIRIHGSKSGNDLVEITHRENSPRYNTGVKNGILEGLTNAEINSTNIEIDMSDLVAFDERKKKIYEDYIEQH